MGWTIYAYRVAGYPWATGKSTTIRIIPKPYDKSGPTIIRPNYTTTTTSWNSLGSKTERTVTRL